MKKNFKKSLAVFMAALMLLSVFSVSVFAATYTIKFNKGLADGGVAPDPIVVDGKVTITLPGACFTREGYVQAGWAQIRQGNKKIAELGGTYKVPGNKTLYPYWEAITYTVTFAPGAYGIGVADVQDAKYNATVKAPGEIFTREGYIMLGWTSVEGGSLELGLSEVTPKITGDTVYYPVWEKCDYTVSSDVSSMNFGSVCVDYATPEAQTVTINNEGNVTLNFTLPSVDGYNIAIKSGELALSKGESLVITIQPVAGLGVNDYTGKAVFACDYADSSVTVDLAFIVNEHSFDKYYSDGNATYEADGTKSAECSNGCGCKDTIVDEGSMKIYSADNNKADGLLKEYLYHKTVRCTAYGSGTDNIQADGSIAEGTLRFLPVSWYVNEEHNGEFENENYEINFVHTDFGKYTLKINYVEQRYENGEWVETGVEDEKSFDYYVGPSEKDEQEIVRPNMIVSIIFGLFAKIAELFSGFFG